MKDYIKGSMLGIIIALLFLFTSCCKEYVAPAHTADENIIKVQQIIKPMGTYKYGYVINGTPCTPHGNTTYTGRMYSNTHYCVNQTIQPTKCDSIPLR